MNLDTKPQPQGTRMISAVETTSPTNNYENNHRILRKYDQQVMRIRKAQLFLNAGMRAKAFREQAAALRAKLATLPNPPIGNLIVLTCLPMGSLVKKLRRIQSGRHVGICDCKAHELHSSAYPPNTLHALLGVCDGSNRRFDRQGEMDAHRDVIHAMVEPEKPLNAWAGVDMVLHYPNVLRQQGLIFGCTTVRNAATALWMREGVPIFGSTEGRCFKNTLDREWGIPSYTQLVTAY